MPASLSLSPPATPVIRLFDTIFLHAGLPKTGSSFLQDSLHALSLAGRLSRVAYPSGAPRPGLGNGSALAEELIFTNPRPTSTERLESLVDDLLRGADPSARDLLISSEDLCYADVEKFSRLKQVLLAHARSLKLLIAVRPLREWSYSVYLQLVKAHALAADYDADWLREHTGDFLFYFRNLDRFEVDTVVFPYRDRHLLQGFLAIIGEDASLAAEVPESIVNRSLSAPEIAVMRAINGVFEDQALGRLVSRDLLRQHPDAPVSRFPAHREADFRGFLAAFSRELERYPGPVMDAVKSILLEQEGTPDGTPEDGREIAGTLPMPVLETALRTLRDVFASERDDAAQYRRLLAYAAGLARGQQRFDPIHYLLMHPDVLRDGCDPHAHFAQPGREEGRMSVLGTDHAE